MQLSVGFLALSDRVRRFTNLASSWVELGLYLLEGPGDKTTDFQVKEWWIR